MRHTRLIRPANGGNWRRHFVLLALSGASIFFQAAACPAFPLNPVRIFARDESPTPGKIEVEVTVWQGVDPTKAEERQCIYREMRTVQTNHLGHFDFWLGEGVTQHGNLAGDQFGLDKKLALRLQYRAPETNQPVKRWFSLSPIDDAYVASRITDQKDKGGGNESLKGVFYKSYNPPFREFSPELARRGIAILYPDGRLQNEEGAFLETTGSTTSGVQEFFDYCSEHLVDGYIVGGSQPYKQQIVYHIWTPLRIRPAQGIRIDTGAVALTFMPELGDAPGLTIDSCMMNDIRIRGLLHYQASGYALAVKPQNLLPLDRFVGNTVVDTVLYITAIACGGKGAVLFDGSINFSRFEFNEINHGKLGIHVTAASNFSNNRILCKHIHGQTNTSVLDENGVCNIWEVNLNCDAMDPLGIVTGGRDNIWFSNVISRTKPGVTLLPAAQGNQFFLTGLNGGFDNKATKPTNRFHASPSILADRLQLGFAVPTPAIPSSGETVVNRNPFPVIVMIKSPGAVSRWTVNDTYGTAEEFNGPLQAGQTIYLSPGESLRLDYDGNAPEWRWRAVQ